MTSRMPAGDCESIWSDGGRWKRFVWNCSAQDTSGECWQMFSWSAGWKIVRTGLCLWAWQLIVFQLKPTAWWFAVMSPHFKSCLFGRAKLNLLIACCRREGFSVYVHWLEVYVLVEGYCNEWWLNTDSNSIRKGDSHQCVWFTQCSEAVHLEERDNPCYNSFIILCAWFSTASLARCIR